MITPPLQHWYFLPKVQVAYNQDDDDDDYDDDGGDDDDDDGDDDDDDDDPRHQHFLPKARVAYNQAGGSRLPEPCLGFLTRVKIFLLQALSSVKIFLKGPSGGQNIPAGPIMGQVFLQSLTQVKYSRSQILAHFWPQVQFYLNTSLTP